MVFIASKLRLPITATVEKFILQTAHARWHKEGFFSWFMGSGEQQEEHGHTGSPASIEEDDEYDDTDLNSSIEYEPPDFSMSSFQNALDDLMNLSLVQSSEDYVYPALTDEPLELLGSSESRVLPIQKMHHCDLNRGSSSVHQCPSSVQLPEVISMIRNR